MKLRHTRAVCHVLLGLIAVPTLICQPAFAQNAPDDATLKLGQRVFLLCMPCHSPDQGAPNKIGPNLWGVFGRKAGTNTGYKYYSDALRTSGITWSEKTLDKWITNPKDMVPGTKMTFSGIHNVDNRTALIAFLKQQTGAIK